MAVPKSRTSKKKTRQRKANWFAKANIQRERALTLGRSVLSEGEGSFIYNPDEEDDDEDDDEYEDDDEDEDEDDEDDEGKQRAASCHRSTNQRGVGRRGNVRAEASTDIFPKPQRAPLMQ